MMRYLLSKKYKVECILGEGSGVRKVGRFEIVWCMEGNESRLMRLESRVEEVVGKERR